MRIYDPSVSRIVVSELTSVMNKATDAIHQKALDESDISLDVAENGAVGVLINMGGRNSEAIDQEIEYVERGGIMMPVTMEEDGEDESEKHVLCPLSSYEDFIALAIPYKKGVPLSEILMDQDIEVVSQLTMQEVIENAGDTFSLKDRPLAALTLSEASKNLARETAWRDLKIMSDVFGLHAKRGCEGYLKGGSDIGEHVARQVRYYAKANEGISVQVEQDYIPH